VVSIIFSLLYLTEGDKMKKFLFPLVALLLFCGTKDGEEGTTGQEPLPVIARSVLIVIAHENFEDNEFKVPYETLKNSGINVTVASTDTTPARGVRGTLVKPDITLDQVKTDDFDGLIVTGGPGCERLWDDRVLHDIVRSFNKQNKMIAAICIAPLVLARAGILEDKIVTAYPSVRDEIGKCCARCSDADVEVSGNVITCSGPKAAVEFATTILRTMSE
jgi:protease I